MIDTTINYHQFLKLKNYNSSLPAAYYDALSASLSEPAALEYQVAETKLGPESGRKPSSIRVSAISSSVNNEGLGINIRPAYYDTLDADIGHRKNGSLSMLEINARIARERFTLNSFDLFTVESNAPSPVSYTHLTLPTIYSV